MVPVKTLWPSLWPIFIVYMILVSGTICDSGSGPESYFDIELNAWDRLQNLLLHQSIAESSPSESVQNIALEFSNLFQSPFKLLFQQHDNSEPINEHIESLEAPGSDANVVAIPANSVPPIAAGGTPTVFTQNFRPTLPPWFPTALPSKEPAILKNVSVNCLFDLALVARAGQELEKLEKTNCSESADPKVEQNCTVEKKKELAGLSWVTKMIDAFGKPGSGLLQGNLYWLGSWQECRLIKVRQDRNSFDGQYCRSNLYLGHKTTVNSNSSSNATTANPITIKYGLCFPDSCNSVDVDAVLEYALEEMRKDKTYKKLANAISFAGAECHPRQHVMSDPKAVATIVILAIWLTILVMASAFDYLDYQPKLRAVRLREAQYQAEMVAFIDKEGVELGVKPETAAEYLKRAPMMTKILVGLSIQSNFLKMMSTERRPGSFDCIHGIRFLSMAWVVLGHTYFYSLSVVDNIGKLPQILKEPTMQTVLNATVSVDSFFVISGILLSYLWLKEAEKTKGQMLKSIKTWFLYFFHRYVRLTPVYMIIMGVEVALFKYLGNGPLWKIDGVEPHNCKYWWTNLLYINNFYGAEKMCMGHSWFLADDMQFHIFAPLILVTLFLFPPIAISFATILMIGSAVWRGYYVATRDLAPNELWTINPTFFKGGYEYFDNIYVVPWMRLGPYVWGLLVGYILFKIKGRQLRIPKVINLIIWTINIAIICAVIYGCFHWVSTTDKMPAALNGVYSGVNRTVWGIAISWIVFACITGNGGFIEKFLSWPGFFPVSRLTYCAYLVHPYVLQLTYLGRDGPVHLDSQYTMVYYFIGHLVIGYATAFVFSVSFEATAMNLEKILLEYFMPAPKKRITPVSTVNKVNEQDEVRRAATEVTYMSGEKGKTMNGTILNGEKGKMNGNLDKNQTKFQLESEAESGIERHSVDSSSSDTSSGSIQTVDSATQKSQNGASQRVNL